MKYRCTHCHHAFELSDREFKKCPNCFWTTSLVNLEAPTSQKEVNMPKIETMEKPKSGVRFFKPVLLGIVFLALATGAVFVLVQKGGFKSLKFKTLQSAIAEKLDTKISVKSKENKNPSQKLSKDQILKVLSETEKTQLSRPFQITIPRQLSEDEEEMLKKQVSFPAKIGEKPAVIPWKKEDFEKLLTTEQKNRKIQLGWNYERNLIKVFEKHNSAARKAFEAGDYVLARNRFLDSLSFPIYRNKPELHRAVVLVMLRPFINDVIGKIAILNQYLVGQTYLTDVNSIFQAYQALFPVFELQEWDRALGMIGELKNQIKTFEQKPREQTVSYPPSFAILDQEIQNAIQTEAKPKSDAVVNLKALAFDLNLKDRTVRFNTAEALTNVQKQYRQALLLIEAGNWEEAKNNLKTIEFPPELVEDVRTKLEIIEKMLALTDTNQNQPTKN